jgi:hypothetical protein
MLENAMRGCATHVVSKRARSAFGLPALVINDTVTQTWGYPGIELGDPITVEYEGVRAWREDDDPRIVFMSKEFLENRTLHHAGAGVFTSFLSKKSATATVSEYASATLEVTEPLHSALLIFTGDTQIRLSTSGRLRGKYKKYYATHFANPKVEALLMAQVDAERQWRLVRTTDWKMVDGFAHDSPKLHVVTKSADGSDIQPYKPHRFAKDKLREKALLRQYKMHGELHALDHYCGGHDLSAAELARSPPQDWGEWEQASTIVRAINGKLPAGTMPPKDIVGTRETIFPSFSKTKTEGYSLDMQTRLMSVENNELEFAGLKDPPVARTAIKELKIRARNPAGTTCADSAGAGGEITDPEVEESRMQFLPASAFAFGRALDDQLDKDVQSTHDVEDELAEGVISAAEIKYAYAEGVISAAML